MGKKYRQEGVLVYQKHQLRPQDQIDFIEMDGWAKDCERLGLTDDDLAVLRICIMSTPGSAPIMRGTGGLRKSRYAPQRWKVGKSGAARICYVYFKSYSLVLLVKAYSKDEKADLSAAERAAFKASILAVKQRLRKGPIS